MNTWNRAEKFLMHSWGRSSKIFILHDWLTEIFVSLQTCPHTIFNVLPLSKVQNQSRPAIPYIGSSPWKRLPYSCPLMLPEKCLITKWVHRAPGVSWLVVVWMGSIRELWNFMKVFWNRERNECSKIGSAALLCLGRSRQVQASAQFHRLA